MSEKVCHNPLTIAAHAESKNYKYWQCTKVKSKFWGKSMVSQSCEKVFFLLILATV
jgi:hypothetical protein